MWSLTPVFHRSRLDIVIAACFKWAQSSDKTAASAIRLAPPQGAAARANSRVPRLWRWTSFPSRIKRYLFRRQLLNPERRSRMSIYPVLSLCSDCDCSVPCVARKQSELEVNVHLQRYGLTSQPEDARATSRNEMIEMTEAKR